MDYRHEETVAPEIKVTVELLLDTEKKIEILQARIDELGKTGGVAPRLNPPGFNSNNSNYNEKLHLEAQKRDLGQRTVAIVSEIEKSANGKTKESIIRLREDWVKDMEPLKEGEDKNLVRSSKRVNRMTNKDWDAYKKPETQPTGFKLNKDDIDGRKASYLDKARGLQQDYSYLNSKEPEKNEPGKDDGPGFEPQLG